MSWLPALVTVDAVTEPVTVDEAKEQCRTELTDDEATLEGMIADARKAVENYTGAKIGAQTIELRCSEWSDLDNLLVAPVSSVTSVEYQDADGIEQTLATSVYEAVLIGLSPSIRLKVDQVWPTVRSVSNAITVTVEAGYATIPPPMKRAILVTLSHWFDNRADAELPAGAKSLLRDFRRNI